MNHTFSNANEVISVYGEPVLAKRKTLVSIREVQGTEIFNHPNGNLTAIQGEDWVVIPQDNSQPYPCKKIIFEQTWEKESTDSPYYHKKAKSRLIQVPVNDVVSLNTLEGVITVSFPDYIVLGAQDEVYSNRQEWVDKNLEFIEK